jgi:hypothetical protein
MKWGRVSKGCVRAKGLINAVRESRTAYDAGSRTLAERRRAVAVASRDMRYFAERLRRLAPAFRIVGEDEADPRNGSISYVSPVARALIGRSVGEIVLAGGQEIEILSID